MHFSCVRTVGSLDTKPGEANLRRMATGIVLKVVEASSDFRDDPKVQKANPPVAPGPAEGTDRQIPKSSR